MHIYMLFGLFLQSWDSILLAGQTLRFIIPAYLKSWTHGLYSGGGDVHETQ